MQYKQHKSFWLNLELAGKIRKNIFAHLDENISEYSGGKRCSKKIEENLKGLQFEKKRATMENSEKIFDSIFT